MTVVLGVRHGEVHNPQGVIYAGLPGYGLSELGRSQASGAADACRALGVVAVYASPLDRAMQTAEAIAAGCGVEIVPDLRLHEWRFWSRWAGFTWDRLREEALDEWEAYQADPGALTDGESLAELGDRMQSWLDDVRAAHPSGVVVGVSHLEPLRAILLRLTERPAKDLFDIRIGLGQTVRIWPGPDPVPAAPQELAGT
jgi:probable phosphoglycerate mutase